MPPAFPLPPLTGRFARAGRRWRALCATLAAALALGLATPALQAQASDPALEARDALKRRDRARLAELRTQALAQQHALAPWIDYWELGNRLAEVGADEVEAFYARWPGSYVEDRLRNDWLLELGRRRDWANFARDYPRFRMNDDREVSCYALLTEHLAGKDVREGALAAWQAQRDLDDGCALLAATLAEAKVFTVGDLWARMRLAVEVNRPRQARAAALLADPDTAKAVGELFDDPARYLKRRASTASRAQAELSAAAIARLAAADPVLADEMLQARWAARLPADLAAWAWAQTARQSALRLLPDAVAQYRRAWAAAEKADKRAPGFSNDTLAWAVRAALRSPDSERWALVQRAIAGMSGAEQRDAAWQYWKARALRESAAPGAEGEAQRTVAEQMLQQLAPQLSFYGKLASEDLGVPVRIPARPLPPSEAERTAARTHPGLARALQLIAVGLRNEGVREWNFSLRGMPDRELLAAAQLACEREVWDRCINTSERTRAEFDVEQRFPTPFRQQVVDKAREIGLDPAYVYGLIRQESRFIMDARSHVGASGLMQIMPATARWTARKIGLPYTPAMITDRDINLKLGTSYLKLVLDDFGGSQAMAAAAYNAGPNRPRRWREGATLEPAIWAENIPFDETRDYVKKVLSNAVVYASVLGQRVSTLKARLGAPIGPREGEAVAVDTELP